MGTSYQSILYEKSENTATIILNRPEVLNAVNETMGRELLEGLKVASQDDGVRCLIITGSGHRRLTLSRTMYSFKRFEESKFLPHRRGTVGL